VDCMHIMCPVQFLQVAVVCQGGCGMVEVREVVPADDPTSNAKVGLGIGDCWVTIFYA